MFRNLRKDGLSSKASTHFSKLRLVLSSLVLFTISLTTISCGDLRVTRSSTTASSVPPTESTPNFIKDIELDSVNYLAAIGLKNITVSCPQNITAEDVGKTFDCQVNSDQGKFRSEVIYKSAQDIKYKAKGLVVLPKIELSIQKTIKEQRDIEAKANCNGSVWIYQKVGETRECSVTATSGETGTAVLTTTGEYGELNFKIIDK